MKIFSILMAAVISGSIFLQSCGSDQGETPEGIISRDTLVEVLANIQIFESANQISLDHLNFEFDLYRSYKWAFDKYGLTEEEFRRSIDFYSSDPKVLESIYDEVIIRISEMQAEHSS